MRRLGWGIIGIGSIVNRAIAPAMVAEPECDLVAAVSRDKGRAEDFAARFGARYAYTDYEEMLANPEVEAVFIATPNALHSDQVVAAARAGKQILCDKPLAITVPDAVRAIGECAQAGVKLGVNFHYRHLPWVKDLTGMIGNGVIGDVNVVHLEMSPGPRTYHNWRADPEIAGLGSVHNVGVHGLDLLRVILDSEPVEVVAMFDHAPGSGLVEMLALIMLRFDNGALVYCNLNESLTNPRNDITVYGSAGRIVGTALTRTQNDGDLSVLIESGETVTPYPALEAHRLAIAAYTRAILGGTEPDASGLDGLRSTQVCAAIARSAKDRRLVEVEYGK